MDKDVANGKIKKFVRQSGERPSNFKVNMIFIGLFVFFFYS